MKIQKDSLQCKKITIVVVKTKYFQERFLLQKVTMILNDEQGNVNRINRTCSWLYYSA